MISAPTPPNVSLLDLEILLISNTGMIANMDGK
jgi:hypothetical protein